MSIPDPTIDPITGLPILDTSGIVEQIPLGNQIIDYSGWKASAQPTRGPLYPDDIIPTFANVSGQHPSTSNAQSIQSDGNHALKVSMVNPSTGGGPIPQVLNNEGGAPYHNAGGAGARQALHTLAGGVKGIAGYTINIRHWYGANTDDVGFQVYIQAAKAGVGVFGPVVYLIYDWGGNGIFPVGYYPRSEEIIREIWFTVPIDVQAAWPGYQTIQLYVVDTTTYSVGSGSLSWY